MDGCIPRTRLALPALALTAFVALGAPPPSAAQGAQGGQGTRGAQAIDDTRGTLSRWVETRRAISREREDWRLGREVLEGRIALLEAERAELRERLGEVREALAAAEEEQDGVAAERARLDAAAEALAELATETESRVRALLPAFPPPLAERVRPLVRRLPAEPGSDDSGGDDSSDAVREVPVATRLQGAVGILNEADKFARDVTLASEVKELSAGGSAEVQTLYLGLGQAWYVNAGGDVAGVGRPSLDGWRWDERKDIAPDVARAIAVLEDDAVPDWVPLPVEITP